MTRRGFARLLAPVAATPLLSVHAGGPGDGPDRRPSPRSAIDGARWLSAFGFTADRVAAPRRAGLDPVRGYADMNGFETPAKRALIAGETLIGEVFDVDPEAAGTDGRRATVRFRVVDALAGALRAGDVVTERMESGFGRDGKYAQAYEPILPPGLPGSLAPGGRYLIDLWRV